MGACNEAGPLANPVPDCLNNAEFDFHRPSSSFDLADDQGSPFEAADRPYAAETREAGPWEHPCLALKKILGDGTFYFSSDFDLTNRLQDRCVRSIHFSSGYRRLKAPNEAGSPRNQPSPWTASTMTSSGMRT